MLAYAYRRRRDKALSRTVLNHLPGRVNVLHVTRGGSSSIGVKWCHPSEGRSLDRQYQPFGAGPRFKGAAAICMSCSHFELTLG
jgi:hypothetical protein